jgi:cyclic beta-1,2-glucan synthetase
VPCALTLLLLAGWTLLAQPLLWTCAVLGIIFIPVAVASLWESLRKPDDVLLGQHLRAVTRSAGRHLAQAAFTLICLPYEAYFSMGAVARTLWRTLASRRRLLEWSPFQEVERSGVADVRSSWRAMWVSPALALLTAVYLLIMQRSALAAALPILGLWFASPAFTWWLGRPLARAEVSLSPAQIIFLRKVARRTWSFFETFVGPDDHWLPPDNYQEHPVAVVAHRTSPTNMGLSLLANLSAYDFGYIGPAELIERTENAFQTMASLERYRGHFYNWYDTQTLAPLAPTYVSTVDSGNLAAHLLTLAPGLRALPDQPVLHPRWVEGLYDTLRLLADAAAA